MGLGAEQSPRESPGTSNKPKPSSRALGSEEQHCWGSDKSAPVPCLHQHEELSTPPFLLQIHLSWWNQLNKATLCGAAPALTAVTGAPQPPFCCFAFLLKEPPNPPPGRRIVLLAGSPRCQGAAGRGWVWPKNF